MVPYIFYFSTYLLYCFLILNLDSKWFSENREDVEAGVAEYPLKLRLLDYLLLAVLLGISIYFMVGEVNQMRKHGWSYLCQVWNLFDCVPPIGIFIIIAIELCTERESLEPRRIQFTLNSIVNFCMWAKIFYFLRVFRRTGYFINMFFRVVRGSYVFFILYFLILCAFGFTFYLSYPYGNWSIFFLV